VGQQGKEVNVNNGWLRLIGVVSAVITIIRFLDDEQNGRLEWARPI
jgi:hypothetical protein